MAGELEGDGTQQWTGIWRQFTLEDGLPDLKIESLCMSPRGFLWIGTHDRGAVCYDGSDFKTFARQQGMAGNGVFSIFADDEDTMYFGTDAGLSRLVDGCVEPIPATSDYGLLWGVCRDASGALWFGLDKRPNQPAALLRYHDGACDLVELGGNATNAGESIHKVICDHDGVLWAGGENLYRRESDGSFIRVDRFGPEGDTIHDMLVRPDGKLWIAAVSGLYSYPAAECLLRSREYGSPVVALAESQDGTVWLLTYGGSLYGYRDRAFQLWRRLASLAVGPICEDRSGGLWIGTYGAGVYHHDPRRLRVHGHGAGQVGCMLCVAEDSFGRIWLGTKRGLATYESGELKAISADDELCRSEITAVCPDTQGRLWLGTWNGQIAVVENDGSKVCRLVLERLKGFRIGSMAQDKHGRVWLASSSAGVLGYLSGDGPELVPMRTQDVQVAGTGVLAADARGGLWLGAPAGGSWNGVARLDGGRVTRMIELESASVVRCLCPGRNSVLWVGTSDGLYRIEASESVRYGTEDGLTCAIITAVLLDREGTLWIGTEGGGVCRYDGSVFQTLELPAERGFAVIRCLHQDRSGRVWLGTDAGLLTYTPRQTPPKVEVRRVLSEREHIPAGVARLSSGTRRVRFVLHGEGRSLLDRLVFRYRLYGHDREWRQTNVPAVEYEDLQPGSYDFLVQAVDSDLNYSTTADAKIVISEDPWVELLGSARVAVDAGVGRQVGRVLLVDRDTAFSTSCRRLLSRVGFGADATISVADAMERMSDTSFDVVLLRAAEEVWPTVQDVWSLRGRDSGPDVLLLADHESLEAAQEATRLGAASYVLRTAEPEQILQSIESIVAIRTDGLTRYLRNRAGELDGRDSVAKRFDMSPSTVRNRVVRCSGVSFSQFLQTARMELGMRLLTHTRLSVQQVASRVGMTHAAFTRAFRAATGWTPVDFRRQIRSPTG